MKLPYQVTPERERYYRIVEAIGAVIHAAGYSAEDVFAQSVRESLCAIVRDLAKNPRDRDWLKEDVAEAVHALEEQDAPRAAADGEGHDADAESLGAEKAANEEQVSVLDDATSVAHAAVAQPEGVSNDGVSDDSHESAGAPALPSLGQDTVYTLDDEEAGASAHEGCPAHGHLLTAYQDEHGQDRPVGILCNGCGQFWPTPTLEEIRQAFQLPSGAAPDSPPHPSSADSGASAELLYLPGVGAEIPQRGDAEPSGWGYDGGLEGKG